jgi:biopolymer transport protein ExbD
MAEVSEKSGSKDGKKRSKKISTKVDMTPMVDLAFLLITFFMLTTNLSKKQAMTITMPKKDKNIKQKVDFNRTVTLILGDKNRIYWYTNPEKPEINLTDYSEAGLREVLLKRQKETDTLVAIIKPMKNSKYKNLVDVMDEVNITETPVSAIIDISKDEEKAVEDYKQKFNIQ